MPKTDAIKEKAGRTLTESDDIKRRWAEYCSEQYEGNVEEILSERMEPVPLRSEVERALNHLRNGKSPGIDNIPIVDSKWRRRNYIVVENLQDGIGNERMATRLVQSNLCSSSKKGDKKSVQITGQLA